MNLNLNTREKTNLLFEVMGWEVLYQRPVLDGDGKKISVTEFTFTHYKGEVWVDLYHPKNFGLAWRCFNWFENKIKDDIGNDHIGREVGNILSSNLRTYACLPGEVAQATLLDKFLILCLDAGLLEGTKIECEEKNEPV